MDTAHASGDQFQIATVEGRDLNLLDLFWFYSNSSKGFRRFNKGAFHHLKIFSTGSFGIKRKYRGMRLNENAQSRVTERCPCSILDV